MDHFNVVDTVDTNNKNDNRNTIINELTNYSENVFQNLIVCSSISFTSILCFSLLFILFISLLYLFKD